MVFILQRNFKDARLVKVLPPPPSTHIPQLTGPFPLCQKCLETFYGVGPELSARLMARYYIHPTAKVGSLVDKQILDLNADLSTMNIENNLRRQLRDNIKRLRDMGTYRGRRHAMGLPVRGQRTRTQTATAAKLNMIERKG
ncbi:MAG: hypothetical protein HETSPECPRED_006160 [Heterodermia speciosa]|uniref:Ribosomal protein S13 n=1 Tax=Heterodermia speciosa TaxID=116794 RepID=A0A8H3IAH4_9LECA|nr:MAG: hypothetical protein HETSPECPRED_006160 [Heterodermia speciosa]